jgi:hypothetical protein
VNTTVTVQQWIGKQEKHFSDPVYGYHQLSTCSYTFQHENKKETGDVQLKFVNSIFSTYQFRKHLNCVLLPALVSLGFALRTIQKFNFNKVTWLVQLIRQSIHFLPSVYSSLTFWLVSQLKCLSLVRISTINLPVSRMARNIDGNTGKHRDWEV